MTSVPDNDADGDGYPVDQDCNDEDPSINPGAEELPGDQISNCDGQELCFVDVDGDGFGTNVDSDGDGVADTIPSTNLSCEDNLEAVNDRDCDDSDPDINPDALDIPNDDIDQDCDGFDETDSSDFDGDGYSASDDCDDEDPLVNPGADEIPVTRSTKTVTISSFAMWMWTAMATEPRQTMMVTVYRIPYRVRTSPVMAAEATNNLDCDDGDAGIYPVQLKW